jgi:hypothetical protein
MGDSQPEVASAYSALDLMPCERCRAEVVPVRPWPHWRKARIAHFAGLGLALCGGPVILADAFVLIPLLMLYMSAVGPLAWLARQQPSCSRCGADLGSTPHGPWLVSARRLGPAPDPER